MNAGHTRKASSAHHELVMKPHGTKKIAQITKPAKNAAHSITRVVTERRVPAGTANV